MTRINSNTSRNLSPDEFTRWQRFRAWMSIRFARMAVSAYPERNLMIGFRINRPINDTEYRILLAALHAAAEQVLHAMNDNPRVPTNCSPAPEKHNHPIKH